MFKKMLIAKKTINPNSQIQNQGRGLSCSDEVAGFAEKADGVATTQ